MAKPFTTRTGALLLAAALLAGLAVVPWLAPGWSRQVTPGVSDTRKVTGVRPDSVAVLPFTAPTGLHDGVTWHLSSWVREVPTLLLEDSTLRVARPRAVVKYQGQDDLLWVGRQLNVATVLVGDVRVEDDGNKLVVEAELLEVDTGLLLWTKTWEIAEIAHKNETLERIKGELAAGVKRRLGRHEGTTRHANEEK